MPTDGKAVVNVVVTEEWDLGGHVYKEGDELQIKASTLARHVASGKCVPKDKAEEFKKIRAQQARANELARQAVAQAEADALRLGNEAAALANASVPGATKPAGDAGAGAAGGAGGSGGAS